MRPNHKQHLYFMRNRFTGLIKIGVAGDVEARRWSLECAVGVPLEIIRVVERGGDQEQQLLAAFHSTRALGEWFFPCPLLEALAVGERTVASVLAERAPAMKAARAQRDARMAEEAEFRRIENEEKNRLRRELVAKKRAAEKAAAERKARREEKRRVDADAEMLAWRDRHPEFEPVTPEANVQRANWKESQRGRNKAFAGVSQ